MKKSIRHKGAKVRMCAACAVRTPKDQHDFIRIVRTKDGITVLDRDGTAEGRGAYVCRSADCVKKLCKTRRLSHLLRGTVEEEIYDLLRKEVGLDG